MTPEQPSPQPLRLPDAVLRPAVGNVFETTVEQLATAIRLGVFVVGEQLPPERDLAERLGVSRNTLREAIAALRESGLVTTTRGRGGGTVVTDAGHGPGGDPPPGSGAARPSRTPSTSAASSSPARPGSRRPDGSRATSGTGSSSPAARCATPTSPTTGSPTRGSTSPSRPSPGRRWSSRPSPRAQAALGELLGAIPVLRTNIEHSHEQHDAVVEAILRGDPDTARTAMEEHCDATSALLRGLIG